MRRIDIITEVRVMTRDLTNSVFRESDIVIFVNQAIDRMKQLIPQLDAMVSLTAPNQEPIILPSKYHSLISVFATARCFGQDERHYQATTFMNEFEQKMDEFKTAIENGEIVLTDAENNPIEGTYNVEYVDLSAYWNDSEITELDEGVSGVPD